MGNAIGLEEDLNLASVLEIPQCFCVSERRGRNNCTPVNPISCDVHCEDPEDRRQRERFLLQNTLPQQLPDFHTRLARAKGAQLHDQLPRVMVWRENVNPAATNRRPYPPHASGVHANSGDQSQLPAWAEETDDEEEEVEVSTQDSMLNFSARGANCALTVLYNQKTMVGKSVKLGPASNVSQGGATSSSSGAVSASATNNSADNFQFFNFVIPSGNPKSVHFKLDRLDHDYPMQFQLDTDFGVQIGGLDILPLLTLERAFYEEDLRFLATNRNSARKQSSSASSPQKFSPDAANADAMARRNLRDQQQGSSPITGRAVASASMPNCNSPTSRLNAGEGVTDDALGAAAGLPATASSPVTSPTRGPAATAAFSPDQTRRRSMSPQRQQEKLSVEVRDGGVCVIPGLYTMKNEVELEVRGMAGTEEVSLYLNGGEAVLDTQVRLTPQFRTLKYYITPLAYHVHSLDFLFRFREDARPSLDLQPCVVVSRRIGVLCRGKQNILPSTVYYPLDPENRSGGGDPQDEEDLQVVRNGIFRRPGIYRMMPYGKALKTLIDSAGAAVATNPGGVLQPSRQLLPGQNRNARSSSSGSSASGTTDGGRDAGSAAASNRSAYGFVSNSTGSGGGGPLHATPTLQAFAGRRI
ncbi:unnamed protein product [Amoebophrya sp. A120]|nr:unnamed protein product [Amoebophrya sp. A120]|eukprot:GSA120T00003130001.1